MASKLQHALAACPTAVITGPDTAASQRCFLSLGNEAADVAKEKPGAALPLAAVRRLPHALITAA